MITLHTWSAPSGRIVSTAIEEMGMPYRAVPVDLKAGDQRTPAFLARNPNGKIPVIEDDETGIVLAEASPILLYLAQRSDRLIPGDTADQQRILQWTSWATSGFGPTLVQLHHFRHFNKGTSDYAEARFATEAERHYRVLDGTLATHEHVAGALSIADFAVWPWVARFQWQGIDIAAYPNVRRWYRAMAARPSVQRGYDVLFEAEEIPISE